MSKVNPFPARTAPFGHILFSNLFFTFEAAFQTMLLTNPGKLFLAIGIVRSVTTFLPNLLLFYLTNNWEIHLIELF